MALDTYAGLKAAIESYVDRDLTDNVDDFIDLAEARHQREVRIREMLVRDPLLVAQRYADLPDRFLSALTIRLLTEPVTPLNHWTQERMDRNRRFQTCRPSGFTIHEQIEFDCEPDQSYSAEIIFFQSALPLSDSVETNEILAKAPDLYLYGALSASAPWMLHDERVQMWESMYERALIGLSNLDQRTVGTPIARVVGRGP